MSDTHAKFNRAAMKFFVEGTVKAQLTDFECSVGSLSELDVETIASNLVDTFTNMQVALMGALDEVDSKANAVHAGAKTSQTLAIACLMAAGGELELPLDRFEAVESKEVQAMINGRKVKAHDVFRMSLVPIAGGSSPAEVQQLMAEMTLQNEEERQLAEAEATAAGKGPQGVPPPADWETD